MSTPQSLRILCFGASLVRGHTDNGMRATPYATWMKTRLEKDRKLDIYVEVDGISGDMVTEGFSPRIKVKYEANTTMRPIYDWVLILGGTNDLAWNKPVMDIFDALRQVSQIALENGAKVLMMTVPECEARSKNLDTRREQLNTLIKGDTRENLYVFDLQSKIPNHSMGAEERNEIWDDGLHFTEEGYKRLGVMVAERLMEILGAEELECESEILSGA